VVFDEKSDSDSILLTSVDGMNLKGSPLTAMIITRNRKPELRKTAAYEEMVIL
jgi:hypothetical protein